MAETFESIVMYKTWLDVARKKLSEEAACKLMVQIMEYGFSGKIPEFDDPVAEVIFDMAQPNVDSNIKKKINGRKGGRKPGGQSGNKNAKKRITTGLSNGNGNGNGNANANGNGNGNDSSLSLSPNGQAREVEQSVEEWEAMIDAL
jgi:hypothetical protein